MRAPMLTLLTLGTLSQLAHAASPPNPNSTAPAAATASSGTCVEHIPEGKARPTLTEVFPERGKSGFTAWLKVTLEHGKGESVLPGGFQLQRGSEEAKALERAQFLLPDAHSPSSARIVTKQTPSGLRTTLSIPFVPLPKEPGRQQLVLPSVPIAVSRASGEILTLCTAPHAIAVEDPTANTPNAKPRRNPKPERQQEEWTLLKQLTYGGLAASVAALLGFLFARWWMKRVRPAPPPPPPRPAWEVALEAFKAIDAEGLIEQQRFADHFDRTSDVVRSYLGALYGFDGLESTTREALTQLQRSLPPGQLLEEVQEFLRKADLVKFARLTPTEAECHGALEQGESFVHRTMPHPTVSEAATSTTEATP